jgi:translation initiation factor 3 subunit A
MYVMAAHKTFQFCKQYKRSTEFRRPCEMIRNRLANLNKSRDRPDLTAPENCQLYLDTTVEQLKIAAELSLSQEAFQSVEDINGLMSMVQRTPKPSALAVYYAKLTEIFWTSESHYLYHVYAWLELFNLHKSHNKNLTRKDLQLLASSVLICSSSRHAAPSSTSSGKPRLPALPVLLHLYWKNIVPLMLQAMNHMIYVLIPSH